MKILVIGGTYFLGKAFVNIACEDNEIVLINRGSRKVSFPHPGNIRSIKADRHHLEAEDILRDNPAECLDILTGEHFDAVVDFCAYEKGDINYIAGKLAGRIDRYIFISTSDVYKRGTGLAIDENFEFETRDFGGPAGQYILGKAALEEELLKASADFAFTENSIRPVFIYGPDNYASRESMFFEWIDKAGQIIFPEDADGSFQMVYVYDAARAILNVLESTPAQNKPFNLTGPSTVTYDSFADALKLATGKSFEKVCVPVDVINERGIPLPFPLTKAESEHYISVNSELLNMDFTPLDEGLKITYQNL